jgi:beta-lactam-binding protein with PASTA domain
MAVYPFSHSSNSAFETRITLNNGATAGQVTYKIALVNTSPSSWQSFNLFSSGGSSPLCDITIAGTNFSKNYTYDWKYSTTQSVRRTNGSPILRDLDGLQFRVGMTRQSGAGLVGATRITAVGSTTATMANNAFSSGTGSATFARAVQAGELVLFSGTLNVTPGSTISFSGSNNGRTPIGSASVSGSFAVAGPPPAPSQPSSFSFTSITTSSLGTSWNASSGASGYELFINGSSIGTTTSTSYNFSGLSSSTSYTVGVRAFASNANGTSYSATSQISATTAALTFTTPNVIGQSRSVAINTLQSAGFGSVSVSDVTSGATSLNNLLTFSQSPSSGTTATAGNSASIQVYDFRIAVPSIIGLTEAQALTTLTSSGFNSRSSSLTTSGATVSNNLKVGSQSPTAGTQFNPVNTVTFTIFNFLTAVPNVVGQNLDTAITNLSNLGFTTISTSLDEVGATVDNVGTVKSQTPVNSGTTYNPANTSVTLTVYSLGVTGKRFTGTGFVALSNSKRFDGTVWQPVTVAKRFNGTSWIDISN